MRFEFNACDGGDEFNKKFGYRLRSKVKVIYYPYNEGKVQVPFVIIFFLQIMNLLCFLMHFHWEFGVSIGT